MAERLAMEMESILGDAEKAFRKAVAAEEKPLGQLVTLRSVTREVGLEGDLTWTEVPALPGFELGEAGPLLRVTARRSLSRQQRDAWTPADVTAWAEIAAKRLAGGIAAYLLDAAAVALWPQGPDEADALLAAIGWIGVLAVADVEVVPDFLEQRLDEVCEVPISLVGDQGYLRDGSYGPAVDMIDWELGWDRTADPSTGVLVAERTLRLRRADRAVRLVGGP